MADSSSKKLAYILFLILGVVWGSCFLFMKQAVLIIQPLQVVWLRVSFGALPVVILSFAKKSWHWKDFRNTHHFIAMAILANILPYYCFVKGTEYLPSGIAGVISGMIPLMTAILVVLVLPSEKLTAKKITGLILGLLGVTLLAHLKTSVSLNQNTELIGALFVLLGAFSFAMAVVYTKKFISGLNLNSLQISAYQLLTASVLLGIFLPKTGITAIADHPFALWGVIIGLGFLGTGAAFVMYYYIIAKLGAVTASAVNYIPPVVALLIGITFKNETVTLSQILGAISVMIGIYLAKDGERAQS